MQQVLSDTDELLTVAQAAERLGTTIPRLRRLLARPEMAGHSRQEALQTQRGTRTSTVIPVPELAALAKALQVGNGADGVREREQTHLRTFSETEVMALQTTLRRTEELLTSKDRELAAKEEIITLLKEKIERLEQPPTDLVKFQEREQEHVPDVPEAQEETETAQNGTQGATGEALTAPDAQTDPTAPPTEKPGLWARLTAGFRHK